MKNFFIVLFISIVIIGCEKDENPSLNVINQSTMQWPITSVTLVGYSFTNLNIEKQESQMFELAESMPGGYNDIKITVRYGPPGSIWTKSREVDFSEGETTTVTLTGCISEGCDELILE